MEAIRPLAAPWQIRHRKLIIVGLALAAIVGLPALGAYGWRTWGPNPLDDLKLVLPVQPPAEQQTAPAPPRAVPATPRAAEAPQKRSEPVAKSRAAPPEPVESGSPAGQGARSTVTHTRRTEPRAGAAPIASPPQPQPGAKAQDPRAASPAECTEAVAALGLCASIPSTKASQ